RSTRDWSSDVCSSDLPAKPPKSPDKGAFLDPNGKDNSKALGADDFQGDIAGGRDQLQGLDALELDPYRDIALAYAPHPPDNGPRSEERRVGKGRRVRG